MKDYSIKQYESGRYRIKSENLTIYFDKVKSPSATNSFDFYLEENLVGSLNLGNIRKSVIEKLESIED